jgi:hypothetical protein
MQQRELESESESKSESESDSESESESESKNGSESESESRSAGLLNLSSLKEPVVKHHREVLEHTPALCVLCVRRCGRVCV